MHRRSNPSRRRAVRPGPAKAPTTGPTMYPSTSPWTPSQFQTQSQTTHTRGATRFHRVGTQLKTCTAGTARAPARSESHIDARVADVDAGRLINSSIRFDRHSNSNYSESHRLVHRLHQADRLQPRRGSGPQQSLRHRSRRLRHCSRFCSAAPRPAEAAARIHQLVTAGRTFHTADHVDKHSDRRDFTDPCGQSWNHDSDPLRREGPPQTPTPTSTWRAEGSSKLRNELDTTHPVYPPPPAGGPQHAARTDATDAHLLLLSAECSAPSLSKDCSLDLWPGRQEVQGFMPKGRWATILEHNHNIHGHIDPGA